MAVSIGQSLRTDQIGRIPLRPVCSVSPRTPIREAVSQMIDSRQGFALVLDRGRLLGIFTERDYISRVITPRLDMGTAVEQVMTPSPQTIPQESTVQGAIEVLKSRGYRHLPVVADGGEVVGVLSVKDIMHYLVEYFPAKVYNIPPSPTTTSLDREGA